MGLFDFIFGNKKREEQERLEQERLDEILREEDKRIAREREVRLAENKRKEAEFMTKTKENQKCVNSQDVSETSSNSKKNDKKTIFSKTKPQTKIMQENTDVSEYLEYLAVQCNMAFNVRDNEAAVNYMNQLFKSCYGSNGHKLLQLSSQNTQAVGLAFSYIALYLNFNDEDLNSVAAENAVYCLGRNIIEKNNTFCAPSIFTTLLKKPSLLKDKLISAHCSVLQKRMEMPIGIMLGGNPFTAPHLNDFREQAITEKRFAIMTYLLTLFYDIESKEFTIPTDLPYNLPSTQDLSDFTKQIKSYLDYDKNALINEGEMYFYELFSMCQDTLQKMI